MKLFFITMIVFISLTTSSIAALFSYTAQDTPIDTDTYNTVTSTISLIDNHAITDLNVFIDFDHPWLNVIDIWIEHNNAWVQLFNQHGGSGNDIQEVLFDDIAVLYIDEGSPPYGPGSYKPTSLPESPQYSNLLSTFNGVSLMGDWNLHIRDDSLTGAEGTLYIFRIEGTTVPAPNSIFLLLSGFIVYIFQRRFSKAI